MEKVERRLTERRKILSTFWVSLVIQTQGEHCLEVQDLSEEGIKFIIPSCVMSFAQAIVLQPERIFRCHFYINPSFFIPLEIKIIWTQAKKEFTEIGAQFLETKSGNFEIFLSFIRFLDCAIQGLEGKADAPII